MRVRETIEKELGRQIEGESEEDETPASPEVLLTATSNVDESADQLDLAADQCDVDESADHHDASNALQPETELEPNSITSNQSGGVSDVDNAHTVEAHVVSSTASAPSKTGRKHGDDAMFTTGSKVDCASLRAFLEGLLTSAGTGTTYTDKVQMLHKSILFVQNSGYDHGRNLQSLAQLLVRVSLHVMSERIEVVDNDMPQLHDIALHLFRQVVEKVPDVLLASFTASDDDNCNADVTLLGKAVHIIFSLSCQRDAPSAASVCTKVCIATTLRVYLCIY